MNDPGVFCVEILSLISSHSNYIETWKNILGMLSDKSSQHKQKSPGTVVYIMVDFPVCHLRIWIIAIDHGVLFTAQ